MHRIDLLTRDIFYASHLMAEAYDRRDKPSVLVTSPSSPDRIASGPSGSGARYSNRISSTGPITSDSNVGGRIQIKLGFESGTLQLILTVICAADLTHRANGANRNPYVKVNQIETKIYKNHLILFSIQFLVFIKLNVLFYVRTCARALVCVCVQSLQIFLLPDRCDKSKRRSKTLANTNDPRWGQTFVYSGLRRADLNDRFLEVSSIL